MKKIDRRIWNSYILKLSKINEAAADEMWSWIAKHSVYDLDEMIDALITADRAIKLSNSNS